jgi:hypothetical protein
MTCPNGCRTDQPSCLVCLATEHVCSGACVSNTGIASCGPTRCSPCPTVTNAQTTCDGTSCGFTCNGQTLRCNTGFDYCEKTSWDFEGAVGADGWQPETGAADAATAGQLVTTTARAFAGTQSLSQHFSASASASATKSAIRLYYWLCGRSPFTSDGPQALNLVGRTVSFRAYLAPDNGATPMASGHTCAFTVWAGSACVAGCSGNTVMPLNQWTLVSVPVTDSIAAGTMSLIADCRVNASPGWSGTFYFDAVTIQ